MSAAPAPAPAAADSDRDSDSFQPARAWATAVMLFVFIIVNFADKVVLGLVAVPMMDELKLTPAEFGMIGSSFFWLFAVTGIAGGFLADRIAARWLLLGMALIWSLMQLPMIYGGSLFAFVASRVLLGMGEGPAWPVALHAVQQLVHAPEHLPRWPSDDRRSRLVFIVRGIDAATLRRSFAAFVGVCFA